MMLICALKPEEIIGIVAAVVLVLSLASIIITAVRSYTLKKKAVKIVEEVDSEENKTESAESCEGCSCEENNTGDEVITVIDVNSDEEPKCECGECECESEPSENTIDENVCEEKKTVVENVEEEVAPMEEVTPEESVANDEVVEVEATQEEVKEEIVADTTEEKEQVVEKAPQKKAKKQVKKADSSLIESEVPFAQAMLEATDKIKGFYNQLKNELMSFEGVKNSITKKGETFKLNGVLLAKFAKGERFVIGFASNKVNTLAEKYEATISTDKLFDLAPVTFIVKSQATAKVCIDIMNNELKEQFDLTKKAKAKEVDYISELEKK